MLIDSYNSLSIDIYAVTKRRVCTHCTSSGLYGGDGEDQCDECHDDERSDNRDVYFLRIIII